MSYIPVDMMQLGQGQLELSDWTDRCNQGSQNWRGDNVVLGGSSKLATSAGQQTHKNKHYLLHAASAPSVRHTEGRQTAVGICMGTKFKHIYLPQQLPWPAALKFLFDQLVRRTFEQIRLYCCHILERGKTVQKHLFDVSFIAPLIIWGQAVQGLLQFCCRA